MPKKTEGPDKREEVERHDNLETNMTLYTYKKINNAEPHLKTTGVTYQLR